VNSKWYLIYDKLNWCKKERERRSSGYFLAVNGRCQRRMADALSPSHIKKYILSEVEHLFDAASGRAKQRPHRA